MAGKPKYDQPKKAVNIRVTPNAWEGLEQVAEQMGISRSELIEQIGRGMIPVEKATGEFLTN